MSLFYIYVDCEGPYVNSITNGVKCCGLTLPSKCYTRLLIFIVKAELLQPLFALFEQVNNADPHLNNGTNLGAL